MQLNDIASCNISTSSPVVIDEYNTVKYASSFMVIDRLTKVTSWYWDDYQADIVLSVSEQGKREYTQAEIELNAYIRKCFPEWKFKKTNYSHR